MTDIFYTPMFNFSYTQEKYDEVKEPLRYYLNWTNIKGNFKYKDCNYSYWYG